MGAFLALGMLCTFWLVWTPGLLPLCLEVCWHEHHRIWGGGGAGCCSLPPELPRQSRSSVRNFLPFLPPSCTGRCPAASRRAPAPSW